MPRKLRFRTSLTPLVALGAAVVSCLLLEAAPAPAGAATADAEARGERPSGALLERPAGAPSGGHLRVVRVTRAPERPTVHNLEVDRLHTYFVGVSGVWVHNVKLLPRPRGVEPIEILSLPRSQAAHLRSPRMRSIVEGWAVTARDGRLTYADGRRPTSSLSREPDGDASTYVLLEDGTLRIAPQLGGAGRALGVRYGHALSALGEPVLAAGEVWVHEGRVLTINNASGHYEPSSAHLDYVVDVLRANGVEVPASSVGYFE